jgi:hypothetical protein
MDPATRRKLEEYFESQNKRLYEFFGRDLVGRAILTHRAPF